MSIPSETLRHCLVRLRREFPEWHEYIMRTDADLLEAVWADAHELWMQDERIVAQVMDLLDDLGGLLPPAHAETPTRGAAAMTAAALKCGYTYGQATAMGRIIHESEMA